MTRRYQSALDLRNDLEEVRADFDSGAIARRSVFQPAPRGLTRFLPWALAGVLSATTLATILLRSGDEQPPELVRRFSVRPPAGTILNDGPYLSPDGMRLLFRAREGSRENLYVQPLDQFAPRVLDGTNGAQEPAFSPDGEWVAFGADGKLKKVPVSGGEPVTLCDAVDLIGTEWGEDGAIVFGSINLGLRRVSAEGGEPEWLLKPESDRGELDFHYPEILPGGEWMLLTRHEKNGSFGIEAYSFASGRRKRVLEDAFFSRFAPTGHVVYGRGQSIFAAPFDLGRMEVSGPSVQVVESVWAFPDSGYIAFGLAKEGTLVYVPEPSRGGRTFVWVDRSGSE